MDADFVRSHTRTPGFAVIDGRAAVFYDGVQEGGPRDHRASGHIAGAHSVPFESVFNDDLTLKSPDELTALFAKADVKPGDTVIGYCHIGQQATAMLFAARTLGHPVLLYDGSFEDWARRRLSDRESGEEGQMNGPAGRVPMRIRTSRASASASCCSRRSWWSAAGSVRPARSAPRPPALVRTGRSPARAATARTSRATSRRRAARGANGCCSRSPG